VLENTKIQNKHVPLGLFCPGTVLNLTLDLFGRSQMSTQKLEYDAAVGGRVTLPSHVTTYHYAAGALQEIRNLVADCQETTQRSSKLIFQTLPKHMRRRAMSHHPKRLPRKYRQAHKSQMGKVKTTT